MFNFFMEELSTIITRFRIITNKIQRWGEDETKRETDCTINLVFEETTAKSSSSVEISGDGGITSLKGKKLKGNY